MISRSANIDDVLARLKAKKGLTTLKGVADLLGLSPGDLNNRKTRGTLVFAILQWAMAHGEDLNDLVYGNERSGAPPPPPPLALDEEKLLRAYRGAGRYREDLLELAEVKARQAMIEARMAAKERAPPEDRTGAGGGRGRRTGG